MYPNERFYYCDRCNCKSDFVSNYRQTLWFCDNCKEYNQILFENVLVAVDLGAEIQLGDTYLARRNTGWKLLTCKENNKDQGFIVPVENAYSFDTHECFKVTSF